MALKIQAAGVARRQMNESPRVRVAAKLAKMAERNSLEHPKRRCKLVA
jgi:hypothetical protein